MNKEEEQTILYLKDCIIKHNIFDEDFILYNIEILINLIVKMQKENEELKKNSIPKETIENKLNKLINNFKENYKKENRTYLSIDSAINIIETIKKKFVGGK